MEYIDIKFINNINWNCVYYYWSNKNDFEKLVLLKKNDKEYFLPSIPYDSVDCNDLIGKYILLFLKTPKILYGILKIKNILNKPKKSSYLEANQIDYSGTNDNLLFDEENYSNLIRLFGIIDVPGLFFIGFEKIHIFENEMNINNINDIIKQNQSIDQIDLQNNNLKIFKYPSKVKDKNIIKGYLESELKISIINLIDKISRSNNNLEYEFISDTNKEISQDNHLIEKINIKFKIPILWNGCGEFKKMFQNPKKKFIIKHLTGCQKCEIINNNINLQDVMVKNKKIIIHKINEEETNIFFDKISDSYQSNLELSVEKKFYGLKFDENNFNLVCCSNEYKNIYSNCLFLLYK